MTLQEADFTRWAAGFFDGEGCIYMAIRGNCFRPRVTVGNTRVVPLAYMAQRWGGRIKSRWANKSTRMAYDWLLYRKGEIAGFLLEIRPFLLIKGREADVMLDYCLLGKEKVPEVRQEMAERLRGLKRL